MSKSSCSEKEGLKKGPWTQEEDEKLIDYIRKHGHGRWRTLPNNAGLKRCGKSCRLRWTNYLRPDIKRGRFSFEEDQTIIHLHSLLGNKWSTIAARLPGRTDNEIKNYWNTNIRKRLLKMGIDPITHTPRLDLLELTTLLNSTLCTSQCSISQNPNYNCVFENTGQLEFSNQNLVSLGFAPENNNSQETLALEQHFSQTQYQYFRQNQLLESPEIIQTKTRDFSTNSINHCANETQFTQTKVDHLSQTLMNRSATLQNNVQAHQDEGFVENRKVLTGYQYSTQSSPITEVYSLRNHNNNQECIYDFDDFANTSFTTSLISTPLMRNYRCSTETSQEENDQRDGFLSTNMFMYDAMRFSS